MSDIEKREAYNTIYNIALSFLPGSFIIKELQEHRGRIYQSRLNYFVEILKESFDKISNNKFDSENLKSEDFLDAFEILVRKAVYTKSKEKIKRYKNILLREMFEPSKTESDFFLKYVNLIEELNEIQILILKEMEDQEKKNSTQIMNFIVNGSNSHKLLPPFDSKYTTYTGDTLSFDDLTFYLQELAGKGLLHRKTKTKREDLTEAETYDVNTVGKRFLKFIKEYEAEEK